MSKSKCTSTSHRTSENKLAVAEFMQGVTTMSGLRYKLLDAYHNPDAMILDIPEEEIVKMLGRMIDDLSFQLDKAEEVIHGYENRDKVQKLSRYFNINNW